jgi:peptidyl-prolyl cis-trans isomerase A (cyclophilin A)
MNRRFALIALPLALAALVGATPSRKKPAPLPPPAPLGDVVRVEMVTALGPIVIDLDHKRAPVTVRNFVRYVDSRRYDGMTFYRAMHLPWGTPPNGIIQAGVRSNPRKVFAPIAHEPTSQTGILHKAGTLSMARLAPGTALAEFSILLSDITGFDADPKSDSAELRAGYAAFGQVVSGMDVVRKIYDAPRSPTLGEGVMKGQMLAPEIKVLTVRRVAVPQSSPTGGGAERSKAEGDRITTPPS